MKNYLLSLSIISTLLLAMCGVINFYVDPYLIYGFKDGNASKLSRIDQAANMRMYKPQHVRIIEPDAIIIGSSRSASIHPRHPAWSQYSTYNFSTPGMTIYEMLYSVKHAHANHPLQTMMIGLDYAAFIRERPLYRFGFEKSRLAKNADDLSSFSYIKQQAKDLQTTLFSLDALGESVESMVQSRKKIRNFYMDGVWTSATKSLTGRGGYIYVAKSLVKLSTMTELKADENLEYFRELLIFCYSNNIDTKFFLTPTHVFMVDVWQQLGTEQLWRDVHTAIVDLNSQIAREYGKPPFEIWGFGNERGIVDEPIYLSKDIHKAWYNDGVHYRPALGKKIMKAVWGQKSSFGEKLDAHTLDNYLNEINTAKVKFMKSNRKPVARLHYEIFEK